MWAQVQGLLTDALQALTTAQWQAFSSGQLQALTTDHTLVQSLVDEGRITEEEARRRIRLLHRTCPALTLGGLGLLAVALLLALR